MRFINSPISGLHAAEHGISNWFATLGDRIGALGVAGLLVATIVLAFYSATLILGRPNRNLADELTPYRLHPEATPVADPASVVTVPLLKRLGELIGRFAERRGFRQVAEARLERAGLAITFGELATVTLIGGLLLALLGALLGGVVGLILAVVVAVLSPPAVVQFLGDRRIRRFDALLPEVLKLLAASLRAGFSLLQGLDSVLGQVPDPMASELSRAFAGTRVGLPVEDALQTVAVRVGSRDFEWVVMAIRIQREVGGNLAEILDTVATTMLERVRLRREVRTLTAEGRISAVILALLPIGLGVLIFLINRPYIAVLFNTFGGNVALLGGVALEVLGAWWLYRTVQIEI